MATKYERTAKHDPKDCFICLGLKWTPALGWHKPEERDAK